MMKAVFPYLKDADASPVSGDPKKNSQSYVRGKVTNVPDAGFACETTIPSSQVKSLINPRNRTSVRRAVTRYNSSGVELSRKFVKTSNARWEERLFFLIEKPFDRAQAELFANAVGYRPK
jgi:hypothetical protein